MADNEEQMKLALMELGIDGRKLRGKSGAELKEMYEEMQTAQALLDTAVEENQALVPTTEGSEVISELPAPDDANWTDYVMGLFDEKELDKKSGMPRVDGLRRVARKLLGEYDLMVQEIPQLPCKENEGRATAIVQLRFHRDKRLVTDAADAFIGNIGSYKFACHPVAIAVTRAEGRALRKALYLTRILAAEELLGNNDKLDDDEMYTPPKKPTLVKENAIQEGMLNSLYLMCDKQGVDLHKVAVHLGFDILTPKDLTHNQGLQIANKLGSFQRKAEEIPEELRK